MIMAQESEKKHEHNKSSEVDGYSMLASSFLHDAA